MKNLRILIVTMDYPPPSGGIQAFTYNLEKCLKEAGHEVRVLNFDGRNINLLNKFRLRDLFYTSATLVPYFSIISIFRSSQPLIKLRNFFYNNLVFRESKLAIREFKPDIIHLTKPDLYSSIYNSEIPSIVSCHSEELHDIYPIRYSLQKASLIHCGTKFAKKKVLQITPERIKDINVINYSIDLEYWSKFRKNKKNNWIITVCRLVKNKNIDSVIKAFSLLPLQFRNRYKYLIIGDGPERQFLNNLIKELNVQNSVSLLGFVSDEKKAKLLSHSKLFVMCSTPHNNRSEGFGITFLEAQALHLPIICSKIGGIPESVGKGGLYVENEKNPQEIADKIMLLLQDKILYNQLTRESIRRIDNFDEKIWFQKILNMYQNVLHKKLKTNEI